MINKNLERLTNTIDSEWSFIFPFFFLLLPMFIYYINSFFDCFLFFVSHVSAHFPVKDAFKGVNTFQDNTY